MFTQQIFNSHILTLPGAQTYEWAPAAEQAAAAQPTTQAYATNYAPVETVPGTNALPANAQATYGQHDRSDSVVGTDFPPPGKTKLDVLSSNGNS